MNASKIVGLAVGLLVMGGVARAGSITTGFAVSYNWEPGDYDTPAPWPESPGDPLGQPDYDVGGDAFGIGRGGILTLDMGVLFTDGPGDDLMVWEYGSTMGGTNDRYRVAVGDAAGVFTDVIGESGGDPTAFDLSTVASSGPFRYIRIFDADTTGHYDGADIDAAEVYTFAPLGGGPAVPEPASIVCGLIGLGMIGTWVRKRRSA